MSDSHRPRQTGQGGDSETEGTGTWMGQGGATGPESRGEADGDLPTCRGCACSVTTGPTPRRGQRRFGSGCCTHPELRARSAAPPPKAGHPPGATPASVGGHGPVQGFCGGACHRETTAMLMDTATTTVTQRCPKSPAAPSQRAMLPAASGGEGWWGGTHRPRPGHLSPGQRAARWLRQDEAGWPHADGRAAGPSGGTRTKDRGGKHHRRGPGGRL